jgi:hypothetical protein
MSAHLQPAMYKIEPDGDYLHVVCVKCDGDCTFDYEGLDPAIPLVEIVCPNCGSSKVWKLHEGSGFCDKTHDRFSPRC